MELRNKYQTRNKAGHALKDLIDKTMRFKLGFLAWRYFKNIYDNDMDDHPCYNSLRRVYYKWIRQTVLAIWNDNSNLEMVWKFFHDQIDYMMNDCWCSLKREKINLKALDLD